MFQHGRGVSSRRQEGQTYVDGAAVECVVSSVKSNQQLEKQILALREQSLLFYAPTTIWYHFWVDVFYKFVKKSIKRQD